MRKKASSRIELEKKIRSLLFKPIKIEAAGSQGFGNTWQLALGLKVNNDPGPDWDDIEVKSLIYDESNRHAGTQLTLSSKTPPWDVLERFGVSKTSFRHRVHYSYQTIMGSLFFTRKLRYVVSEATRSIDWYIVKQDCPPTEPYSVVPARIGEKVFSWNIEEALHKVQKLSFTYLIKSGETLIPIKSFIIDTYPDKFLELLTKGSIVYEVRYNANQGFSGLWKEVEEESKKLFPNDEMKKWEWFDEEFKSRGGRAKDYGTAFRMARPVLNSILNFAGEILPVKLDDI